MYDTILRNSIGTLIMVNFVAALSLLFFPKALRRTNDFLNIWVSTRQLLRPLDTMIVMDDQIYKHHKTLGVLFLIFTPISKNISGWLIPVSIIAAVFLLFFPNTLKHANDFLNTWFSIRKLLKPLEILRNIDDKIYEKRKVLGAIFLILVPFLIRCYILF